MYHSALAQLVEQLTVNQWVAGSSPAGGAKFPAKRFKKVYGFHSTSLVYSAAKVIGMNSVLEKLKVICTRQGLN